MKKEDLQIIKEGKTGYGILIENDGYAQLDKKDIIKEGIGNGEWHVPNPFIISCLLQRAGTKNANGRVYPKDILEREVKKYQVLINERRALGECYPTDAMVLCESGWKNILDVKEGENVLSLNVETNEIELEKVIRTISYDYKGDMVRIKNKSFNDLTTPNHKFLLYSRYNKFKEYCTADELYNKTVTDLHHSYIPKIAKWNGEYKENFTIPKISSERYNKLPNSVLKEKYKDDLVIPINSFAKFMGIYLSEGWFNKNGYNVCIAQKKKDVCQDIEDMLDEWGINYTIENTKNDSKIYIISDIRLHGYVKQFGKCYNKYVPMEIKSLPSEQLRMFYDWFVKGDGRIRNKKTDDVFSTSKKLVMDLNEIQLKIGYNGTYHSEDRNYDRMINGRLIESKNSHEMHFTRRGLSKGSYFDERHTSVTKEYFDGKVACIEVNKNHNFFVMYNGFTHWTGNCDHPSDSTISLQKISHNIVECHWEGDALIGKLELNITEGFRKLGVVSSMGDQAANLLLNGWKIGISSRAVGSVEQKLGVLMVGDDLELLGWDLVSSPSTPDAWLGTEDEVMNYIGNNGGNMFETKKKNPIITEKISKLKNILK